MKLVVVGGVAAGMSAAARARRLDEKAGIVVFEKGAFVSFANCGLPYHIGGAIPKRESLLLQTPRSLAESLNLDVRCGVEVIAIDRSARKVTAREAAGGKTYEESYDKLVLAPGAVPLRPPLPGIEDPRIMVLRNVEDMDRIKKAVDDGAKRAAVIGGGYIGVEMAENLKERGLEVDLIEMAPQLMPPLDFEMARDLERHMKWHGVRLHLGLAAAAFTDTGKGVRVELKNGDMISADFVVMAAGVKPDVELARQAGLEIGERGGIRVDWHMRTSDPDIYAAGDAVEVQDFTLGKAALIPLAGPANRQGRIAADNICGRDSVYTASQGTAIVKVFDMTGGGTGANERILQREGIEYRKVYLHPSGHAGYYPGSAPMHLKLLFTPDKGRILGAQVVGYDGIDKRIDVLATAVRAGMHVKDFESLELAYAPPYGSAKDPVNMAGFLASNLLAGDIEQWYAEDYPEKTDGALLLDVRSHPEYESWHIPGARCLPLGELRAAMPDLPRDKPILLYCKVGFRSYLAYRALKQQGFEVKTLAGGTMTFCSWHDSGICPGGPEPALLPYAEEFQADTATSAVETAGGRTVELDCSGLQCPGPIRRLSETIETLAVGDELAVKASDPGFAADGAAWAHRFGHEVLAVEQEGALVVMRLRKRATAVAAPSGAAPSTSGTGARRKTMVVFSGDLDRVMAALIIANGAVSMGSEVVMFFTFWGLNALRKSAPQASGKNLVERMFGWMMPRGAQALKLSRMNMLGVGTLMMRQVMRQKRVDSLPQLIEQARAGGVRFVACSMSMDVMGLRREELLDGVEIGGVATFLGESEGADQSLFI